jgi:hypothetical protein
MAGMFYSLKEVSAKLNKTEDEVKEIVKQGRLREFRDGSNLLFKVDEVESLMSDTSMGTSKKTSPKGEQVLEEDEIILAPDADEDKTDSTAMTGKGIEVLGEADDDYKLADDTLSATKAVADAGSLADDILGETKATSSGEASLEEIEEDVNLDTFGSGSGLLDLSLQADDTSLGGILDEIYTPEGDDKKETPEASSVEVSAAAEQLIPDAGFVESDMATGAPVMVQAYAEAAPDAMSNALGVMLLLPLLAVIYTAIVAVAGFNNMMPSALTAIQSMIWYIVIGAAVASVLIVGVGFMLNSKGKGGKTKVKKEKTKKVKKEKKAKKGKKGKEAPPEEPEPESKSD